MARLNTSVEVLAEVTEVGIMTDVATTPGDSTLAVAAVAAGDRSIEVLSATNFVVGDRFRIGDRPLIEAGEIEAIAANVFTLMSDLADGYAIGEVVREVQDTVIGDITEEGISVAWEGGDQPVRSGTKRGVLAYIPSGDQGISITFALLNMNLENFAAHGGIAEADITGAGTAVDPYVLHIREDLYAAELERIWYFEGVRIDGQITRVEGNSGRIFAPQGTLSFAQGTPSDLPFVVRVLHGVKIAQWT